jgi:hypothetical protein
VARRDLESDLVCNSAENIGTVEDRIRRHENVIHLPDSEGWTSDDMVITAIHGGFHE